MAQIAIRCHPSIPVDAADLEDWLQAQVEQLRAEARPATLRLARLTQPRPSGQKHVGWLLEVEVPDGHVRASRQLVETIRDMRLLGFQPTVLAPAESGAVLQGEGDGVTIAGRRQGSTSPRRMA
jgi:hypothetical protein